MRIGSGPFLLGYVASAQLLPLTEAELRSAQVARVIGRPRDDGDGAADTTPALLRAHETEWPLRQVRSGSTLWLPTGATVQLPRAFTARMGPYYRETGRQDALIAFGQDVVVYGQVEGRAFLGLQ